MACGQLCHPLSCQSVLKTLLFVMLVSAPVGSQRPDPQQVSNLSALVRAAQIHLDLAQDNHIPS